MTHCHSSMRLCKILKLASWTITMVQALTKANDLVTTAPLRRLYEKHRCFMLHRVTEVHFNVIFQVPLFNLHEKRSYPPERILYCMYDAALHEQCILSVKENLGRSISMKNEELKSAHLESKKRKYEIPLVPTKDLPLLYLDNSGTLTVRGSLPKYDHIWYPDYNERCNITEHHIGIVPRARQYSQPYRTGTQARKVTRGTVDYMRSNDIIEPSQPHRRL